MASLYGREYRLECYLPEPKRSFGYFALPLLYLDRDGDAAIVGRLDAKADRSRGAMIARRLSLDLSAADIGRAGGCASMARAIAAAIREFAAFNGAGNVRVAEIRMRGRPHGALAPCGRRSGQVKIDQTLPRKVTLTCL